MSLDKRLSLLEMEQVIGENRLKVFDVIGTKAAVTDYAILCGAYVSDDNYVDNIKSLENRTGYYWTKTDNGDNDMNIIINIGISYYDNVNSRNGCVRPALPFSEIKDFCSDEIVGKHGELKYVCGELPEQVVSEELEKELKIKLKNGLLKEVDYVTTDKRNYDDYNRGFEEEKQKIYDDETTGKRYAYIKAKPYGGRCILSNGKTYQRGDYVFVERQPIYWVRDEETDIVFPEKLIASGVQFNLESNYKGDFEKTDLYRYMNTYLVREIFSNYVNINNYDEAFLMNCFSNIDQFLNSQLQLMKKQRAILNGQINTLEAQIAANEEMKETYYQSIQNNDKSNQKTKKKK